MNYKERMKRASRELSKRGIDVGIITSWQSLLYLTGLRPIQSRSSSLDPMPLLLSAGRDPVIIPTAAFAAAVELEHKVLKDVRPYDGPEMWSKVAEVLKEWNLDRKEVGIESKYLSCLHARQLKQKLPGARFIDCFAVVEDLRMTKDDAELALIRGAARITDRVVDAVSKDSLKPGMTELEVAGEIIRSSIENGAEGASFHPQVFSGRRGYLLNISSSSKKLERGEVVMLDFGVSLDGYNTDTTRTFVLGKATARHKQVAKAALRITNDALGIIRPGVKASDVHKRALKSFKELGYDGLCRHYTGHGTGLSPWEKPLLREFDDTVIGERAALAVEQGLYFPTFGIRFEENLIVTKRGIENLFEYPTELVEVH